MRVIVNCEHLLTFIVILDTGFESAWWITNQLVYTWL